jgi:hypothetical protein
VVLEKENGLDVGRGGLGVLETGDLWKVKYILNKKLI